MHIHEYQAKMLLKQAGAPIPQGIVVNTPDEALSAAKKLGQGPWVIKAQVYAGGRGKGGGVQIVRSINNVFSVAQNILSKPLITPQTTAEGVPVHKLYVEKASNIAREFYLSLVLDKTAAALKFIASQEGGTAIEELAQQAPEKVLTLTLPLHSVPPFIIRELLYFLNLPQEVHKPFSSLLSTLHTLFMTNEMELLEINPLVLTTENELMCLDAKMTFDDSALERHPEIKNLADHTAQDPIELTAQQHDLNYIKLHGNIGCLVNGAGLAMATMDIIQQQGGAPANFLDVGGGATKERISVAIRLILQDPQVQTILINIFGGIVRCDLIAEALIEVVKEMQPPCPLIVRLEGTNVDKARALLKNANINIRFASTLLEAAKEAVAVTKQGKL